MVRDFYLTSTRERIAWIVLILALLSLPTSAVLAFSNNKPTRVTDLPIELTTETSQIPDWDTPLDPEFSSTIVTYNPNFGTVIYERDWDDKGNPSDEADYDKPSQPEPYDYEPKWPDSPTVKIIATWPVGEEQTECTGVLVGETAALTAGHCVFPHNPEHREDEGPCWVDTLDIIAFQDTTEHTSGYTALLTWAAWTENRDFNYDLAGIKLVEPLGSKVGWLGFGYHNNNQIFLEPSWEHTSFPVVAEDPPISSGTFSFTEITNNVLHADNPSEYGQSGSGAHRNEYDHIVYSILSHHRSFGVDTHTAPASRRTSSLRCVTGSTAI